MPTLPPFDTKTNINHAPHVVILGAGASFAAFPHGDAYGHKLPLMRNLVSIVGLEKILKDHEVAGPYDDFEALYDDLASTPGNEALVLEIESRIGDYFRGLRLPEQATIYDYLVLSLREKDLIATFNWDPFLAQAYRRNAHLRRLPKMVFLHGNVEVGACADHRRTGFVSQRCSQCGAPFKPSRLLYPVKHKDYNTDPFIKNEWEMLRSYLKHAYFITIFGYSAPITDVEAKKLMLDEWKANASLELAEVDVVDIRPPEDLEETWKDFLFSHHYSIWNDIFNSYLFRHPRRSCDAFAMATLQCAPWADNPFPRFSELHKLQDWTTQLMREEEIAYLSGQPCPTVT